MEFNIQQYLEDFRGEVNGKLDTIAIVQTDHEARLQVVESTQRNIIRVAWAIVCGVAVAAWDLAKNHFSGRAS